MNSDADAPQGRNPANVGNPYISGNAILSFESLPDRFPSSQGRNFVMRNFIKIAVALGMVSGWTAAGIAAHAPAPRISMAKARAMALKLAPGKIISSEYEKEGGIWRYSFDIQQPGNVQEIGIDGRTGKVVENKSEGKVDHD
jgi:hypothetical protein